MQFASPVTSPAAWRGAPDALALGQRCLERRLRDDARCRIDDLLASVVEPMLAPHAARLQLVAWGARPPHRDCVLRVHRLDVGGASPIIYVVTAYSPATDLVSFVLFAADGRALGTGRCTQGSFAWDAPAHEPRRSRGG